MDPRYPIGKFEMPTHITEQRRKEAIAEIASTPRKMRAAVAGLTDAQLETPYRDGGWTVRQVVHHVPDSHMNAFIRLRLALTENNPTIKTYEESEWAKLADAKAPIAVSQTLLDALHERWDITWRCSEAGGIRPAGDSPRQRSEKYRLAPLPLRVARQTPHRPHHHPAQTKILVTYFVGCGFSPYNGFHSNRGASAPAVIRHQARFCTGAAPLGDPELRRVRPISARVRTRRLA